MSQQPPRRLPQPNEEEDPLADRSLTVSALPSEEAKLLAATDSIERSRHSRNFDQALSIRDSIASSPKTSLASSLSDVKTPEVVLKGEKLSRLDSSLLVPLEDFTRPRVTATSLTLEMLRSLRQRLDRLQQFVDPPCVGCDVGPFWSDGKTESCRAEIRRLLTSATTEEESKEIAEQIKKKRSDLDPTWVETVTSALVREKDQLHQVIWLARNLRGFFRSGVKSLELRASQLEVTLNAPSDAARLLEVLTTLEGKKAAILAHERQLRYVASKCRELSEIQATRAEHLMPTKMDLTAVRERLNQLDAESAELSMRIGAFDNQVMKAAENLSIANELFASLVIKLNS